MRLRSNVPFLLSLLAFSSPPAFADSSQEASQLLQAFSAGCATQGQWTQTALGYASNLVDVLKTLQKDPDCKSIGGALSQAQSLSSALSSLTEDQNQRQLASLKQQEQELMLLMSQTTDATQLGTLIPQLQSIEVQISEYQSYAASDGSFQRQQQHGQALSALVTGTNTLVQQVVQNQTCIQKNKAYDIIGGVAGLAGSVAAATIGGPYGMIIAAAVDITDMSIEAARQGSIARRINKMSSAITASAYQCVLETLSNQWCAADDTLRVIRIQGDALTTPNKPTPLQNGITLLNRDSQVFLSWLDSVRAGTDPGTQATATLQALELDREKQVRAARVNGLGIIAQNQEIFSRTSDPQAQWNLELQTISSIVISYVAVPCTSATSCPTTPLGDVFSADPGDIGSWFLIGVPDSSIPRDPNTGARKALGTMSFADIPKVVGNPAFKPDFGDLKNRMLDWVALARDRVNTELAFTLNLDPQKLIINAATPDLNGTSPFASLQMLIHFLETQQVDVAAVGSFMGLYDDTISRLKAISCDITQVLNLAKTSMPDDCKQTADNNTPIKALENISKQAVLDNGTGFLGERIQWALRLALNQLVVSGHSGIDSAEGAALLARNDIIAQLQANASSPNLNLIARDIQNSQVIIEKTLSNFTDEFGKGIHRAVDDYSKQAKRLNEGSDGSSNQAVSELCLKLLASPVWPKDVPENMCYGRSLGSVFKTGPTSDVVTKELIHAGFKDRVCKFRDYNRRNQFFQTFLKQRPNFSN